jgi:hypothetical protein
MKIYRMFPEINAKYDSFARTDMDRWTSTCALLTGIFLLGTIRYIVAWLSVLVCVTSLLVGMIGADTDKPLGKVRGTLIYLIIWLPSRMHLLMSGVF